jgi:hypothetical protein
MTHAVETEPEYKAPPLGAYPVDEHLAAQNSQIHPGTGKPMHDPETGDETDGDAE